MENIEKINKKLNDMRFIAEENLVPILRKQTAQMLKEEINKCQPKQILEIGTAIGYSGILMLSQSENSYLTTIEKDEESAKIAKQNFEEMGLSDRVEIKTGDAKEILPLLNERFDFIFLDGPKGQYFRYCPYLLEMLNNNGVLFSDNVLYRGMVNGKTEVKKNKRTLVNNLRIFLKMLDENENLNHRVIDIEDGVSIAQKIN